MANIIQRGYQNGVLTLIIECEPWGWVGGNKQTKIFAVAEHTAEEWIESLANNAGITFEIQDVEFGKDLGFESVTEEELKDALINLGDDDELSREINESSDDQFESGDGENSQGSSSEESGGVDLEEKSGSGIEREGESGVAGDATVQVVGENKDKEENQIETRAVTSVHDSDFRHETIEQLASTFNDEATNSGVVYISGDLEIIEGETPKGRKTYKLRFTISNTHVIDVDIHKDVNGKTSIFKLKAGEETTKEYKISPRQSFKVGFSGVGSDDIYYLAEGTFEALV